MSKITATFDGLKITIKGAESATAHQLYIVSEWLKHLNPGTLPEISGKSVVTVDFNEFSFAVSIASDVGHNHLLALAAEFALAAQHIFSAPRLSTVVQMTVQATLQAIAEQAQAQQIMAGVKKSPGGVLTPR